MAVLVADTSALVSLGVASAPDGATHDNATSGTNGDGGPDPLSICLDEYAVFVPDLVIDELREVASYDDTHARAATLVLDRLDELTVTAVELDATFPLDDGENAAVTLANEMDAELLCCDEFAQLGLIHASLADTRLVTTPTLLSVFVRAGRLTPAEARDILDAIGAARSWESNSYVERARSLFRSH